MIFDKILKRMGYSKARRSTYAGANTGRLYASWPTTNLSADAELRNNLNLLRARSRELERNNDYAKKFLRMVRTNVVGSAGIILQGRIQNKEGKADSASNKQVEENFREWSKKGNCDVTGELSFRDIQKIVIGSMARDGEILVRKIKGFDNPHKFALQLIEADHLDMNYNQNLTNGNRIKMGVELDSWSRRAAYWIYKSHPGDIPFSQTYGDRIRIPASDMLHLFIPQRISQTRGIPWMHAALTRLNMLGGYEESELVAARAAAAKMGFFLTEEGDRYTGDSEQNEQLITEADPGTFEQLPIGMKFEPFDPQHPTTAFEAFVKRMLKGISSGLDVSYNYLANDLSDVNYSSIRAGVLDERDVWRDLQAWMCEHFLSLIYIEWLKMALVQKIIPGSFTNLEKYKSVKWQTRGWPWVDPKADMLASMMAVNQGFNTASNIVGEHGRDLEDIYKTLAEEKALREKYGIKTEHDIKHIEALEKLNEEKEEN